MSIPTKMLADMKQSFEEYEQEQEAIHEGRATELTRCYMCLPFEDRVLDMFRDPHEYSLAPLRGIRARNTNYNSPDPTEVLSLMPCGHKVL